MQVAIIAVGKAKERHWREAQEEYVKRLGAYASIHVEELTDEPDTGNVARAVELEGDRILGRLRDRDYVTALVIDGDRLTSEGLARRLLDVQGQGHGRHVFVIGGSNGLHTSVLQRANWKFSMSALTFPHALARVILLEQLYRSFRIQTGAPYHK